MTDSYLRYPHLHADLLTFVAADDLWLAPAEGGRAWRLTSERAPVSHPRFSPDGQHIAYICIKDGRPEVYLTAVADGRSRRLTWWGALNTLVLGWNAEGEVLVASHHGQANLRHQVVHAVSMEGQVRVLDLGPAWGVALDERRGRVVSTSGSRPPAHWKRYRGGTAPQLWHDPRGKGRWQRLLEQDEAALVDPMWVDGSLVFTSDREATFPDHADGQANLWRWDKPGRGTPQRLTEQGVEQGYVRDATTDGRRIVWHSRGDIWLLDSLKATPRRVSIEVPGVAPTPFAADPLRNLDPLRPDHGGDASLVTWRGNAYWLRHREGPARALVADSAVRVRDGALLGRTGEAVLVTDAEGEDALEVHHLTGEKEPRRLASGALGRVLHLAADPSGERVCTISHDGAVRLVEVGSGRVREVTVSTEGEAQSPTFSPDGRYLAWSQPTGVEASLHRLMVLDLKGGTDPVPLTSGKVHDHSPAFSADGKHLMFLSDRTFDPQYDSHEFGLTFSGATRPWLIPLAATEPAPFGPSSEGWRISKEEEKQKDGKGKSKTSDTPPASPDLDADGAEERIVPFPVPSGSYRDLQAAKGGVVWVRVAADPGQLGSRRAGVDAPAESDVLEYWSFRQRQVVRLAAKVDSVRVCGDGTQAVIRHKDVITVQPADHAPEEDDTTEVVTLDMTRLRFQVDPVAEWHQMFDENARIMRDHFWRADMDGVDWDGVVARWRPLVSRIAGHHDLVDLLWETVGELNTSHAYVTAPDRSHAQQRLGLLGADLSPAAGGWRIDRILPGESTEPQARSPLRAAGVDAREGDVIVAVDGVPVDPAVGPNGALIGAAGKPVEVTLRRGRKDRRVVVVPIEDEEVLRYQDWVRGRRAYVEQHSGGRLGYLHVPDMQSYGWAQLHRDLRVATRAEGIVADVRYNRGGHTSQLVLARLLRRIVGWAPARHYGTVGSYPDQAPRGPVVLVANRHSGSDGDIVNAAAQAYGLGPVIGERTWGGVVGIDGRFDLVDGTSITQPRYAFWLEGKGFGVENHGVDPDIEVVHSPADFFSDADPQLDRAIAEALDRLERHPAASPPPMPEPKVR